MTKVSEQITPDGQRVVETHNDGLNEDGKPDGKVMRDVIREATLAEQVDARAEELLETVRKTFVGAVKSAEIDTSGKGGESTITIKLSSEAKDDAPAPAPRSDRK